MSVDARIADAMLPMLFEDGHARGVLDQEGQGFVTVDGRTTHAYYACTVCGLLTGSRERPCDRHPAAGTFLRHIREAA